MDLTIPPFIAVSDGRFRHSCAAVIPCRNESATIASVVHAVRRHLSCVIVIDDGSEDDTAMRALAAGASVIRNPDWRGKGASLVAGWQNASQRLKNWVILIDGDGQHDAEEIPNFFAALGGNVRMVIGNRMNNPSDMPWTRRVTNRWMSRRISRLTGIEIPDSQCGFRLIHLPTLMGFSFRSRRFEIESELCVTLARGGHSIVSVPIRAHYAGERSKILPFRDTCRWWVWYFRDAHLWSKSKPAKKPK